MKRLLHARRVGEEYGLLYLGAAQLGLHIGVVSAQVWCQLLQYSDTYTGTTVYLASPPRGAVSFPRQKIIKKCIFSVPTLRRCKLSPPKKIMYI